VADAVVTSQDETSPDAEEEGDSDFTDASSDVNERRDVADENNEDEGDAGPQPDAGVLTATANAILAAAGQACSSCAISSGCLPAGSICDNLAGSMAAGGPDAGESREQLCLDTLKCILSSECYEKGSAEVACICGTALRSECIESGAVLGSGLQCVQQEQAGLETTDPSTEFLDEYDANLGAGVANTIVDCISKNLSCVEKCFMLPDK
jgi:hypothetical protein